MVDRPVISQFAMDRQSDWMPWYYDNIYEALQNATTVRNILIMKRVKQHVMDQETLVDELQTEIGHLDSIIQSLRKRNLQLQHPKRTRSGTKY